MLQVHTENIGDMAVIECAGRIARNQALALRDAVIAQNAARIVVVDFSAVNVLERGGVGMLIQAEDQVARLKADAHFKAAA